MMSSDKAAELPSSAAATVLERHGGQVVEHHAVSADAQAAVRHAILSKFKGGKRLNTNQRQALEIRVLQRQVAKKTALANQLEVERSRLKVEHQLLVECCESLQLLRVRHGDDTEAIQDEVELLEQLQNITFSSTAMSTGTIASQDNADNSELEHASHVCAFESRCSASASAGPVPQDLLQKCLSPPHDRMYYLRYLLSLPPLPDLEHCTLESLIADYTSTVHMLALQLHIAESPFAAKHSAVQPAQKIKERIDRHLRIIASLVLHQRADLVQRFTLTNFETLQTIEEPSVDTSMWLIQAAGITEQQQADIALGMQLFDRILAPIMEERQQLQQQTAEAQSEPHGTSKYRHQLELQRQRVERLALLCRKEYQTRMAAACWVAGHLTYRQACVLMVKSAPVPPSLQLLGKIMQEQQQQRQSSSK